ncbi:MAG: hypothetical protein J2P37_01040 [Ktedonobacteraceae bacterium]|nr:hypothetical protein [Ktedonobacteraceae bacterium]
MSKQELQAIQGKIDEARGAVREAETQVREAEALAHLTKQLGPGAADSSKPHADTIDEKTLHAFYMEGKGPRDELGASLALNEAHAQHHSMKAHLHTAEAEYHDALAKNCQSSGDTLQAVGERLQATRLRARAAEEHQQALRSERLSLFNKQKHAETARQEAEKQNHPEVAEIEKTKLNSIKGEMVVNWQKVEQAQIESGYRGVEVLHARADLKKAESDHTDDPQTKLKTAAESAMLDAYALEARSRIIAKEARLDIFADSADERVESAKLAGITASIKAYEASKEYYQHEIQILQGELPTRDDPSAARHLRVHIAMLQEQTARTRLYECEKLIEARQLQAGRDQTLDQVTKQGRLEHMQDQSQAAWINAIQVRCNVQAQACREAANEETDTAAKALLQAWEIEYRYQGESAQLPPLADRGQTALRLEHEKFVEETWSRLGIQRESLPDEPFPLRADTWIPAVLNEERRQS